MSQKKVDEYKNYKKNRRENIKKEKRKERLTMAAMWGAVVVFIACVGGAMGVSIYNKYQAKQAALPTYGSTSFILSDMAGIQKEDTEDQTQSETETSPKMLHLLSLLSLKVHLMKQQLLRKHQIRRHSPRQKTKRQSPRVQKNNHKKGLCMHMRSLFAFYVKCEQMKENGDL